jgi:hypothetical protein
MAIKKSGKANDNGIKYEVVEKCGVISESNGYSLELRYVSWNGNEPKYDIRQWYERDGVEKCGKGITLTGEQLEILGEIIKGMEE